MPLNHKANTLQKIVSHRAIDYDLMRSIVAEVQNQNTVFHMHERLTPYPTLDALGNVRGDLLRHRGDIHQISLIDRIGEITVSFFNLPRSIETPHPQTQSGRVIKIKSSP